MTLRDITKPFFFRNKQCDNASTNISLHCTIRPVYQVAGSPVIKRSFQRCPCAASIPGVKVCDVGYGYVRLLPTMAGEFYTFLGDFCTLHI